MIYTIKDLAEGKCIAENDGTPEQLQELMKLAFPNDLSIPIGDSKFYMKLGWDLNKWTATDLDTLPKLPIQSVKVFLKQNKEKIEETKEPELKRGDRVYVSNISEENAFANKLERIFIAKVDEALNRFMCVNNIDTKSYINGGPFSIVGWNHAVKVPTIEATRMTIAEIEKKLGIERLEIIDKP